MLRALGLGKAVLVSDVGAFREFPDSVCLRVPVGPGEEDLIYEYLNLLVSRPALARTLGESAKTWVMRECNWAHVAAQYARFLEAVYCGATSWEYASRPALTLPSLHEAAMAAAAQARPVHEIPIQPQDIQNWAENEEAGAYIEGHKTRLIKTLEIIPPGTAADSVLEMGIYFQITPSLTSKLGYGHVEGCYYGEAGRAATKTVVSADGGEFSCTVSYFDAEKDRFPYDDESFSTVLCCELIEHLFEDPMFMMSEINRILKPGGHLVLSTPNIASMRALSAILNGYHPGFFPSYIKPGGEHNDHPRHNREYTPDDIHHLLVAAGFDVARLETGEFRDDPHPDWAYVRHILSAYNLPERDRGDGIYAVGRKTGPVRDRWPGWLYY
jgi:SAM-dependent methyltransferase